MGVGGKGADALGWGVRCNELRVGLLQLLELPEEPIVFRVASLGSIEDVVAVGVVADQPTKLLDAAGW